MLEHRLRLFVSAVSLLCVPSAVAQNTESPKPAHHRVVPRPSFRRILGIRPNCRAVPPGMSVPPATASEAFHRATENSFQCSSFVFLTLGTLWSKAIDSHPQLGKGLAGFGRYYWRGFIDQTDANYMVLFALPTMFRQDERYFIKGTGRPSQRALYAASRIFVTPDYHGKSSFNASEIFGRAIVAGISSTYYPRSERTVGRVTRNYLYALGTDAASNVLREFWPEISERMLHRRH